MECAAGARRDAIDNQSNRCYVINQHAAWAFIIVNAVGGSVELLARDGCAPGMA